MRATGWKQRDVARKLSQNYALPIGQMEMLIDDLFSMVVESLKEEGFFRHRKFGTLKVKEWKAKKYGDRNGNVVVSPPTKHISFVPVPEMKAYLNPELPKSIAWKERKVKADIHRKKVMEEIRQKRLALRAAEGRTTYRKKGQKHE